MRKSSRLILFAVVIAAAPLLMGAGPGGGPHGKVVHLTAHLTGAQEVPAADPDAKGKVDVRVDVAAGTVCFDARFDKVGTPNRAHIHRGVAGVNGGIVVAFFELQPASAPATDPRHDALEKRHIKDCVDVADTALLQEIVDNPAGFYVNMHNTRYPGGAFRCQLER